MRWMILGFAGLMFVGFFMLPAMSVDPAVHGPNPTYRDEQGPVIAYKSGLRIAVEGRLRWLGLLSKPLRGDLGG